MTIAAGFRTRDGIVICADRLVSGRMTKVHENKIRTGDYGFGSVVFAISGHSEFGLATINKCERMLRKFDPEVEPGHADIADVIEDVLEQEYRRHVFSQADWYQAQISYRMLVAIWSKKDGGALYNTFETTIRLSSNFECLGIGEALGHYLVLSSTFDMRPLWEVAMIGANIIAQAKQHVEGCGGRTQIVTLDNNGVVKYTSWIEMPELDSVSERYREVANWFQCQAICNNDEEFDRSLRQFVDTVRDLRSQLGIDNAAKANAKKRFERLVKAFMPSASLAREARQYPVLTKDDCSPLPPSPE